MYFSKTAFNKLLLLFLSWFFLSSCGVLGLNSVSNSNNSKKSTTTVIKKPRNKSITSIEKDDPLPSLSNPVSYSSKKNPLFLEEGVASWYGPNFHGKKTANGEKYDMNGLTAAHRTLAFNSIVRVTNLENGKSVDVRINDRGPYAKDRIIDISKEAADKIDMIQSGTATIRLELIEGITPDMNTFCSLCESFAIQIAAFKNIFDANLEKDKIKGAYIKESITDGKKLYRVLYGNYDNKNDAEAALNRLRKQGIDGFVKQLDNI
jgi:rare lipoprotein A